MSRGPRSLENKRIALFDAEWLTSGLEYLGMITVSDNSVPGTPFSDVLRDLGANAGIIHMQDAECAGQLLGLKNMVVLERVTGGVTSELKSAYERLKNNGGLLVRNEFDDQMATGFWDNLIGALVVAVSTSGR